METLPLLYVTLKQKEYLEKLELQWRTAPPCSSWDTGRVAPLIFSPGVKSSNNNMGNCDTKVDN